YGSVTSAPATMTVNAGQDAPAITSQPESLTVAPGGSATFAVAAGGNAPLTYQWMLNGTAFAGATGATYTNGSVQAGDAGKYTVVVTNSLGSVTSQAAVLTVSAGATAAAPVFVTQPHSDAVALGHGVSFSSAASSSQASTFQWQVSTDGGFTWSALSDNSTYSGTSSGTLSISAATAAMNGYHYRLVATNSSGSTVTNGLTLTVTAPPFPGPSGLAVDSAGNLFVSDGSNNTIQFVTPAGVVDLLAGTAGQQGSTNASYGSALFRQPLGVALEKSENLYVADTGNSLIRKITPAGVVTTLAGSSSTQGYMDATGPAAAFNSPQALATDGNGNVYVADTANSAIRMVTAAGVVTTIAGNGLKGTADGAGYQARFNQPSGIVLDSAGNIYVADTNNDTIRKITTAGTVSTWAGVTGVVGYADGSGAAALFNHPTGLAIDGSGNVYVADTGNETIRVVAPDGTVRTLAGLPTVAGLLDGNGTGAWFNQPEGLGLDASGNLYVADNGNAALRKISPSGDVTTVALTQTTSTPVIPSTAGSSSSGSSSGSTSNSGSTSTTSAGGGSGGGAIEPGFVLALLTLAGIRRRRRRKAPRA
ncbi:MAG: immunoglobulin domain-containing protein, partial [Opitutales bacterium]